MLVWSVCNTMFGDTTHPVPEVSLSSYSLFVLQCWQILLILSLRSHCSHMVCNTVLEESTHPVLEVSLCWYGLFVLQCGRILLILSFWSQLI